MQTYSIIVPRSTGLAKTSTKSVVTGKRTTRHRQYIEQITIYITACVCKI